MNDDDDFGIYNPENDFNAFYNPANDLNTKYDNEIHIYKHARNGKKCTTIIKGLNFTEKIDIKNFLSKIKKKFGIAGCQKILTNVDETSEVFVFSGDYREKIKTLLIESYNKEDDFIKIHG